MTTNKREEKILSALLRSVDRSIRFMKKSRRPEAKELLAEYLRCKANILIRSNPKAKYRITYLMNQVDRIIKDENLEETETACNHYLTYAWYYTYVKPDRDKVMDYISMTYDIKIQICENDLDFVDEMLVPAANLFFENEQNEEAKKWLLTGIRLCKKKEDIIPYARKKEELYSYLNDVDQYTK